MNDPEPVIDVQELSKTYRGGGDALRHISLQVPRGQVLGLLGKNGAGKTTLIKCLLGLLRPTTGSATVLGDNAWDLSAAAKARLGYVPQVAALPLWMKVKHLIAYTGAFYDHWNSELVDRLRKQWELPPDSRAATLSVGQLQRLSILLALGHEPELLILDEPAAALDPAGRRQFLGQLLEMAGSGVRTVLLSTHITSDIERVADSVAILRDGRLMHHGALDELKDSVKRLHVTMNDEEPPGFAALTPGLAVLRTHSDGKRAVVTVRGATPVRIEQMRRRWVVEVEDLNLEDIFLELHDGANEPALEAVS